MARYVPPFTVGGCEKVLTSEYSVLWGIPVALIGALYLFKKENFYLVLLTAIVSFGFILTLGLVYLQLFIISAIYLSVLYSYRQC